MCINEILGLILLKSILHNSEKNISFLTVHNTVPLTLNKSDELEIFMPSVGLKCLFLTPCCTHSSTKCFSLFKFCHCWYDTSFDRRIDRETEERHSSSLTRPQDAAARSDPDVLSLFLRCMMQTLLQVEWRSLALSLFGRCELRHHIVLLMTGTSAVDAKTRWGLSHPPLMTPKMRVGWNMGSPRLMVVLANS